MSQIISVQDEEYLKILTNALDVCKTYKPKFGHGKGLTLAEFQSLYQSDPFYAWLGLDSPLMYSAHKAAGGMTSVYRQIGIGCERLIRHIIIDSLDLTLEQANWSYKVQNMGRRVQTLSLDCKIVVADTKLDRQEILKNWLQIACSEAGVINEVSQIIKGAVFEIRQGYKSKDSKRQNADVVNASTAYANGYLPALLLLSSQIDDDVAFRYKNANWLILRGNLSGSSTNSTYKFCREILAFDLANFFEPHALRLKQATEDVLKSLLV